MIDSHVNLHHKDFADDYKSIIQNAFDNGLSAMLTICDRIDNFDKIIKIANEFDNIWASVGVHPHEAKDFIDLKSEKLIELAQNPKVIGFGETGLDYYYNFSPVETQKSNLLAHINASQATQLPIIIHTRDADNDMMDILLSEYKNHEFPILLHCYTSGQELMKKVIDIGGYVSISGIATFKNAEDVRNNINFIPQDRLLIETDCPYLAPIPMRGRRNEPLFVKYVLEYIANYLSMPHKELEEITDKNFYNIFKRAIK